VRKQRVPWVDCSRKSSVRFETLESKRERLRRDCAGGSRTASPVAAASAYTCTNNLQTIFAFCCVLSIVSFAAASRAQSLPTMSDFHRRKGEEGESDIEAGGREDRSGSTVAFP
jgi:hypothetical protein